VVDRYTVKFKLKHPAAYFLGAFYGASGVQVPMIARESVNADGTVTHPIGTGPFEFVEWKQHEYTKFKKFKDYWKKGKPYLDEVIYKVVSDPVTRMAALQTGEVDMVYELAIPDVAGLMKKPSPDYTISMDALDESLMIHFNCSKPPFDNVKVRQAVAYAMDKQQILDGTYLGFGQTVNQNWARTHQWYSDVPDRKRDIDKAKALLKEAGYPNGLEFTLTSNNMYRTHLTASEILQAQLSEAGFKVKLDVADWPTTVKKLIKGEFQADVVHFNSKIEPGTFYPIIYTPQGSYAWLFGKGHEIPKVTALLAEAAGTKGFENRKALYTEVTRLVQEDAPLIWMAVAVVPVGWRSNVKDFKPSVSNLIVYSGGGLEYTWLDK
jgi:ABC-type transport system substrate-binding protein